MALTQTEIDQIADAVAAKVWAKELSGGGHSTAPETAAKKLINMDDRLENITGTIMGETGSQQRLADVHEAVQEIKPKVEDLHNETFGS